MNSKQRLVFFIAIVIIIAAFLFVPKYKIVNLDGTKDNYIKTKQSSSLYKACKSPAQFDWPFIARVSVPVVVAGAIFIVLFRDRDGGI